MTALLLTLALHSAPFLVAQSDEARARALFKEGTTAYNLGQFDVALAKYSDAYKYKNLPDMLFNIAQCHRQLGNFERAAFFFGRFLDTAQPKAPNVELAKTLLDEMKQKQAEQKTEASAKAADEARKADAAQKAQDELKQVQMTPVEPAPVVVPPAAVQPLPPAVEEVPLSRKGWFWGVMVAVTVTVGAGVAVVALASQPKPPTPTLMDINGRM